MNKDIKSAAESFSKTIDSINKVKFKSNVEYMHSLGERRFDEKLSEIEDNLLEDVVSKEKLKKIKEMNNKLKILE